MGEFCFAVAAAFLIFMVILPAFGLVAGIFFRVGVPYAAGILGSTFLVWPFAGGIVRWGTLLLLAAAWVTVVWLARRIYQERRGVSFDWHEGHYRAAYYCLTLLTPQGKRVKEGTTREMEECRAEA